MKTKPEKIAPVLAAAKTLYDMAKTRNVKYVECPTNDMGVILGYIAWLERELKR